MATTVEKITDEMESSSLEDITAKHRKEKKELQAKIQALKKNAPKNDKKKRKEAMEEIARMEKELEDRQSAELKDAQKSEEVTNNNIIENDNVEAEKEKKQGRVSKAQKRREKKARENQEREKEIIAAADEAKNSEKSIELRKMKAVLKEQGLALYTIPSDGDCLFNAIRHQLIHHGFGEFSAQKLRFEAANFIFNEKKRFIFYMTDANTGEMVDDDKFNKYCEALYTTHVWGGQLEVTALANVYKVPIEVLQADGPPILHATEFADQNRKYPTKKKLTITFHRHMYTMGHHYNSTIPLEEAEEESTGDEADINATDKIEADKSGTVKNEADKNEAINNEIDKNGVAKSQADKDKAKTNKTK